jgi:hypothetical protein
LCKIYFSYIKYLPFPIGFGLVGIKTPTLLDIFYQFIYKKL